MTKAPACTPWRPIEMAAGAKSHFCGKPEPLILIMICGLNGTPVQSNIRSAEAVAACTQRLIHWKGMTV